MRGATGEKHPPEGYIGILQRGGFEGDTQGTLQIANRSERSDLEAHFGSQGNASGKPWVYGGHFGLPSDAFGDYGNHCWTPCSAFGVSWGSFCAALGR